MPIFEFMCSECGDEQSQLISYEKSKEIDCNAKCLNKDCKGYLMKKISLSGFQLRGKDWSSRGR